eukprot:m.535008 g.535008  ORF g.535008 m.535008 type:complete len:321 (+) comp22061_c0_seq5:179-1141(+)
MTEPQTKATAGADTGPQNMRLFIGGVPHGTTQSELESRFGRYGKVSDVEVVHHANGLEKTFAYITLEQITSSALMKLRATYNNSRWKGSVLRLQKAKPNFQERLALDKAEVSKIIAHMEERAGLRKERKSQTPQYKMNDKNNRTWVPGPRNKPLAMLRIRNPSTHRVKRVKAKDILSRHTDLSGSLGTLKAVPSSQLTWTLESSCSESSDDGFDSDEGSSKVEFKHAFWPNQTCHVYPSQKQFALMFISPRRFASHLHESSLSVTRTYGVEEQRRDLCRVYGGRAFFCLDHMPRWFLDGMIYLDTFKQLMTNTLCPIMDC